MHRAAPAALERGLEQAHQVLGLFLDLDLGVADDAEGALPLHRVARKQLRPMNRPVACSIVIKRAAAAPSALGRRMKRSILLGMRMSAFIALPSLVRASCSAMVKPRLGMNGNGCAGSIGERREQRKNLAQEMVLEPGLLLLGHLRPVDQHDAVLGERLAQLAPALLLVAREHRHRLGDAGELLGRRQAVGALGGDAGAHLALEAGDADHEEFVEVVGRDREEAHPFEQRMGDVLGLFQHAAVEMEPGQLPIDEALGACRELELRRARACLRRRERAVSSFKAMAWPRSMM